MIRIRSVTRSVFLGENFWGTLLYGFRSGTRLISCLSDRTVISGELGVIRLL